MDGQDFAARPCAASQDAAKDFRLTVYRRVVARTGVETHFADVTRLVEKSFPKIDLPPALRHQLRMQAERGSDVFR
jgi:hypothetical protein